MSAAYLWRGRWDTAGLLLRRANHSEHGNRDQRSSRTPKSAAAGSSRLLVFARTAQLAPSALLMWLHRGDHDETALPEPANEAASGDGAQTLHRAWVGDIRAARSAGSSPASAPIRRAAVSPPIQARVGMTMAQPLLDA